MEALQAQVALARQVQLRHSTAAAQGLQEQLRSLTARLAARQVRLGFFLGHARSGYGAASAIKSSDCCPHLACNCPFHPAAPVYVASMCLAHLHIACLN